MSLQHHGNRSNHNRFKYVNVFCTCTEIYTCILPLIFLRDTSLFTHILGHQYCMVCINGMNVWLNDKHTCSLCFHNNYMCSSMIRLAMVYKSHILNWLLHVQYIPMFIYAPVCYGITQYSTQGIQSTLCICLVYHNCNKLDLSLVTFNYGENVYCNIFKDLSLTTPLSCLEAFVELHHVYIWCVSTVYIVHNVFFCKSFFI